jgi:hypothetical protein
MLKGVIKTVRNEHGEMEIESGGRIYTCTNPPEGATEGAEVTIGQALDQDIALEVRLVSNTASWPADPDEFDDPRLHKGPPWEDGDLQ